jgi:hypothetical protein
MSLSISIFNSMPLVMLLLMSLLKSLLMSMWKLLWNFCEPTLLGHVSTYKFDVYVKIFMKVSSGPTIMVMSIFKSSFPCILLYVLLLIKWLVRSKEQLVPAYMHVFPVKRQVRSKEQFVPCLCFVIGQTASSIQRTVCTCLHVVILIK